jgi:hypothetical protein
MNTERHGVFIEQKSAQIYHKSFVASDDGSEDKIFEDFWRFLLKK